MNAKLQLGLILIFLIGIQNLNSQTNYALNFNGSSAYVKYDNSSSYNSTMTIEAWIKTTTTSVNAEIVGWGNTSSSTNHAVEFRLNNGKLEFGINTNGWACVTSSGSVNTGNWVHVAVVKNGTTIQLYINGVQDGSGTISQSPTVNVMEIGGFYYSQIQQSSYYFSGGIDEVRIWDSARSSTDISNNMYKELAGTEGLTAYYKMNEGSGSTLNDNKSGGSANGSIYNATYTYGPTALTNYSFDSNTYGDGSWIGYVYQSSNWPPNPGFQASQYLGSITQSEKFNQNWGGSGPTLSGTTYIDNFHVRHRMNKSFAKGKYDITVGGDDGFRLSVDGGSTYIITDWSDHGYRTGSAYDVLLGPNTNLVLDFFEIGGGAQVSFDYTQKCLCSNIPTSPSTSVTGTTTATISWSANGNGSSIYYYWDVKNAGGTTIKSGNTTSTSASVTGLTANSTYYFTVYSSNSCGASELATSSNFTTYNTAPSALSYIASPVNATINTSTVSASPTVTGTVVSYNISPALPSGISLDTSSGVISGTASVASSQTDYTVTATNSGGSTTATFRLTVNALAPSLTTTSLTNISKTSANSGGNITSDGGAAVTARGVCWSTVQNPSISDNKTTDGTGTGSFSSSLTGLSSGTVYYIRAYASNSVNTSYGEQKTFQTLFSPPGNALAFDGVNDYVNVGNSSSVQLSKGTIEAWIKTSDAGSWYRGIVVKQLAYGMFLLDNQLVVYDWSNGNIDTGISLNDNKWHHVAFSFESDVQNGSSIYIDGLKVKSFTYSVKEQSVELGIGNGMIPGNGQNFNGSIDEVRVWNTIRTESEIQSTIYSELAGNESGLVTYFNCNQGIAASNNSSYSTLFDLSSSGNNGALNNFSYTGTASNYVESYGMVVPVPSEASNITGSGFTANWSTPNIGSVSSYKLDISTSSSFSTFVTGYDGLDCGTYLSKIITGLSSGTTYYCRVRANKTSVDGTGGYFRTIISTTTLDLPTLAATTGATAITSTNATSGGNITSDGGAAVTARGVCWSTAQNPTISDNKTSDGTGTGSFSSSLTGLSAGTIYYVRAYASNSVGTNYGTQISFTYTTADKKLTDLDQPVISDIVVADGNKFTSDASGHTIHSLTIQPGGKSDLTNTLAVIGDVHLKADKTSSFSLNIGQGLTVSGAVKYLKTLDDSKWYFMSFPCKVRLSDIKKSDGSSLGTLGTDWFVKWYDGSARIVNLATQTSWKTITDANTQLNAYQGYIFGFKDGTGTIEISIPLDNALVVSETEQSIPVVAHGSGMSIASNHKGWNLIGQPYLSKLKGSSVGFNFLTFSDGISTYSQQMNSSVSSIDPFAAFFVQASTTESVAFTLSGRQLSKTMIEQNNSDVLTLNFSNATMTDNTTLILDDSQSPAYQIGQDLEKWIGTGTDKPQVYTMLNGINFVYNALPMSYIQNLPIGFYTKTAGSCTISVDASQAKGLNQLLLTDNATSTVTDLLLSSYTFTATAGTNTSRFVLNAPKLTTDNQALNADGNAPWISTQNGKIVINNLNERTIVRVFDAIGRQFYHNITSNNQLEIILAADGIYSIQIQSGNNTICKKIAYKRCF